MKLRASAPAAPGYESDSEEVRNDHEQATDNDQKDDIGHEIREDHQGQPANQWHDRVLLPAVNEEAEPD
jgi:hypothetical protein